MTGSVPRNTTTLIIVGNVMRVSNGLMLSVFAVLGVVLVALHSPGEMSVDSVMSLYEAMTGFAAGWGPTFMSATLAWLGGSTIGTCLFVALNCVLTYGCFVVLLTRGRCVNLPRWQVAAAFLLALNPLFMFYVGIIWKDVMLATMALVAATLLLLAADRTGRSRFLLLGLCILVAGMLVPIRQQGVLIAIPLAVATGWLVVNEVKPSVLGRMAAFTSCIALVVMSAVLFNSLSAATVKPPSNGSVSVGIFTIQAYDIAGMIAGAKKGDPAAWSGASLTVQKDIHAHYSSERIDTIWQLESVRTYFNKLSAEQYMSTWANGIKHDPGAYVRSRLAAFASLLGLRSITGCVPTFWGIGALPEQVSALGLKNGMDARARFIGHTAIRLYATPVFRNWFYAALLLLASAATVCRLRDSRRVCGVSVASAAGLYFLSFLPTTIACDFRYLYPVACLSTLLCIYLLSRVQIFNGQKTHQLGKALVT